jgi:A/G-specific adenine glycosylase
VGEYTAAAIAAMVYGERVAAVDGNALRVYARLAADETEINTPKAMKAAHGFYQKMLPKGKGPIRDFTQAVMELGALVCLPAKPNCAACPLLSYCAAFAKGTAAALPRKAKKKPSPVEIKTVVMVINPRKQVLTQKREGRLLRDMHVYCLYDGEAEPESAAYGMGFTVTAVKPLGKARHAFTHRIWDMAGYAVWVREAPAPDGYRFMSRDEVNAAPFPSAVKYFTQWFLQL